MKNIYTLIFDLPTPPGIAMKRAFFPLLATLLLAACPAEAGERTPGDGTHRRADAQSKATSASRSTPERTVAPKAKLAAMKPFAIDFSTCVGKIRRLNGVCNATPLANTRPIGGGWTKKNIDGLVRALEIPAYRFHDAVLENPGIELVDVSRIFPLFHADADDPRNYDFRATDDYLRQVVATGAEIEFRLGESIEHSPNQYFVRRPPDFEKWADICIHIIRHYNAGWANGHRWNIRRWSIWEEPDTNPQLLTGSGNAFSDIYLPLYKATVIRIKREFSDLLVGGPQGWDCTRMRTFVEFCAREKLPIDFFGYTQYARNPNDVSDKAKIIRKLLDGLGYTKTEISLCEWHFGPIGWGGYGMVCNRRLAKAWYDDLTGCHSAAYTAALLIHMQDAPVDSMYYYAMRVGPWGLFDENGSPLGPYWAMYAFAQLAKGDERVAVRIHPYAGWWILASRESATGVGRILVATMRTDNARQNLDIEGDAVPVSVRVIGPASDCEVSSDWSWDPKCRRLSLTREVGDCTVWLIETRPNDRK